MTLEELKQLDALLLKFYDEFKSDNTDEITAVGYTSYIICREIILMGEEE